MPSINSFEQTLKVNYPAELPAMRVSGTRLLAIA